MDRTDTCGRRIERSGRFILKGKASEIDRQLKAMCAVENRKGRVPSNNDEAST